MALQPCVLSDRLHLDLVEAAYNPPTSYNAVLLLHIIQLRRRKPLDLESIEYIAKALTNNWHDKSKDPCYIHEVVLFIKELTEATFSPEHTLDEALYIAARSPYSKGLPVICPATTTAYAVHFIANLKKRCQRANKYITCIKRLFLIAYIMAAKYIQVNLLSVICIPALIENLNTNIANECFGQSKEKYWDKLNRCEPIWSIQIPSAALHPIACPIFTETVQSWIQKSPPRVAEYIKNNAILSVNGIHPKTLCYMSLEFLHLLDYRLHVGQSPLQLWPWLGSFIFILFYLYLFLFVSYYVFEIYVLNINYY
ncbi:hypothetical protein J3Q64DRAFT_1708128 [Phycomyces blakesleeanus]|uniref:Uncharacterized protein n=1 Tax=Phycomyces blakesleeanus TaxID=4837 RepID=A0ABR3BDN4_PHYBL